MAISKFPEEKDRFTLIASSTPTTGSSVSFTSISTSFRKLWLVTAGPITLSTSANLLTTVNSLTASTDYRYFRYIASGHSFADEAGIVSQSTGTGFNCSLIFQNANSDYPFAEFDGIVAHNTTAGNRVTGWIFNASTAITTINLTLSSGDFTTNTGTIYLYGTY